MTPTTITYGTDEHRRAVFAAWRQLHAPNLRRTCPVGITKSTSRRRVYDCICGAEISESAKYPQTKRVATFISTHNETCFPRS